MRNWFDLINLAEFLVQWWNIVKGLVPERWGDDPNYNKHLKVYFCVCNKSANALLEQILLV
jgi:hypothetical protein